VQRAVYLCAFGQTPRRKSGWNNYRWIRFNKMTHLGGRPSILNFSESFTRKTYSPDYIQEQMAKAWGFDFYLPRKLMLLRFDRVS